MDLDSKDKKKKEKKKEKVGWGLRKSRLAARKIPGSGKTGTLRRGLEEDGGGCH